MEESKIAKKLIKRTSESNKNIEKRENGVSEYFVKNNCIKESLAVCARLKNIHLPH